MKKMKRFAAMAAALLICSGTVGYMPQGSLNIGSFTANAATDTIADSVEINEVNFPDDNFRQYIMDNFDTDGDGVLSAEEIAAVTEIIFSHGVLDDDLIVVSDLTGIEYFTNLEELNCNDSNLTEIDLSKNKKLKYLSCEANELTTLDLSSNTALIDLYCRSNNITELDLTNNTALEILSCGETGFWSSGGNMLTELDLSNNTKLRTLMCDNNNLTKLDLSNNKKLTTLSCGNNKLTELDLSNNLALESLQCHSNRLTTLNVSNNKSLKSLYCYSNQLTTLDINKEADLDELACFYNQFTSLSLSSPAPQEEGFPFTPLEGSVYEITLTDNTFDLSTLPAGFDISKVSEWTNATVEGNILTVEDASKPITYKYDCGCDIYETFTLISPDDLTAGSVAISSKNFPDYMFRYNISQEFDTDKDNILSADEIAAVTEIECSGGFLGVYDITGIQYFENLKSLSCIEGDFAEFDLSHNKALEKLYCDNVKALDLSNNTALKELTVYNSCLTTLDLSNNSALEVLYCSGNNFATLDLSKNTALKNLKCYENQLTSLDVSGCIALNKLSCEYNQLTSLDLSNNTALEELDCEGNNLTSLDVSNNTALTNLYCNDNKLTSLDVSNNTALTDLSCSNNKLTSLDISNNTALSTLYCVGNQLTSLDISNNTALKRLSTDENKYEISLINNTFELSKFLKGFDVTKASDWTNATVEWWSTLIVEDDSKEVTYKYDCGQGVSEIFTLIPSENFLADDVKINEVNFPDENFREYIRENFDTYGNFVLSAEEIAAVTEINIDRCGISDLTGIEYFKNLEVLSCDYNKLTELDLSQNKALERLCCNSNFSIESIDVSENTALKVLRCSYNKLTSLDVSNNIALEELYCSNNILTTLNVSNNAGLIELWCDNNQLTSLDLSQNKALEELYCGENFSIESIDVSENTALKILWCGFNKLTSLDLSNNTALEELYCNGNNLSTLDLSNNTELEVVWCQQNQLALLYLGINTTLNELQCYENQLTSLNLSNNTALKKLLTYDNKYEITLTDNTFDLSTLPAGFDVSKASEWTNGTVKGNILTVEDITKEVTYKYGCGNEHSEVFTLVPPKTETPVETTTTTNTTTTSTATTTTTAMFTTTTYTKPSYSYFLNVYPYDEADTIYEIGEELDLSTICVYGYGGGEDYHADIPYISLDRCSYLTVDASEFDNTKPGTYTIYVKWHNATDSFEVTVVEPAIATSAATTTSTTTTTTTMPTTTFTTTTFAPPSYSCSLNVYPYDEADTIYEIGEELDFSTICVHGYGTMTSFGSTSYLDIPYVSLDKCGSVTIDASEFDNTKPGTYTIYVEWYNAKDSFEVTVIDESATTSTTTTAPETTTTTTPATTTTPEENLPQTGYSEIYRYIMLIAGAMVIFGIYAMAKGRKEDITG